MYTTQDIRQKVKEKIKQMSRVSNGTRYVMGPNNSGIQQQDIINVDNNIQNGRSDQEAYRRMLFLANLKEVVLPTVIKGEVYRLLCLIRDTNGEFEENSNSNGGNLEESILSPFCGFTVAELEELGLLSSGNVKDDFDGSMSKMLNYLGCKYDIPSEKHIQELQVKVGDLSQQSEIDRLDLQRNCVIALYNKGRGRFRADGLPVYLPSEINAIYDTMITAADRKSATEQPKVTGQQLGAQIRWDNLFDSGEVDKISQRMRCFGIDEDRAKS